MHQKLNKIIQWSTALQRFRCFVCARVTRPHKKNLETHSRSNRFTYKREIVMYKPFIRKVKIKIPTVFFVLQRHYTRHIVYVLLQNGEILHAACV